MAQGIYELLQETLRLTTKLNKQLCCCKNDLVEKVIQNLPEGSTIDDFIDLLSGEGITITDCKICKPKCTLKVTELGTNIGNYILFGSPETVFQGVSNLTGNANPDFLLSLDCCPNIIASVETYLKYAEAATLVYNLDLCCSNILANTETYLEYAEAFVGPQIPACGCPAFLGGVDSYFYGYVEPNLVECPQYPCINAISSYFKYEDYCSWVGITPLPDPGTSPLDYISYNSPQTSCNYIPSLQSCVLGLETTLGQTDLQTLLDYGIAEVPGFANKYSSCQIQNWLNNGITFNDIEDLLLDTNNGIKGIIHLTEHSSKNIGEKINQLLLNDIPYTIFVPPSNNFGIRNILDKGIVQTGNIFNGKDVFYKIENLRSFCSTLTVSQFAFLFSLVLDKGIAEIGIIDGSSIFYKFLNIIASRTDLMSSAPPNDWINLLLNQGVKIQFADNCQITISFIQ